MQSHCNRYVISFNGEIYNYKFLYDVIKTYVRYWQPITNSDCEVIIHLYRKFGIEKTVKMLDGVFSFVMYDTKDQLVFMVK